MGNSLSFNGVDLSTYGFYVLDKRAHNVDQIVESITLRHQSYALEGYYEPRIIEVPFVVIATGLTQLKSYLDSIYLYLMQFRTAKQLIFDTQNDRYYMAQFLHIDGVRRGQAQYEGLVSFKCSDHTAYKTTEDSNDHTIDAAEDTITEAVGGSAPVRPVYTLTPGEDLASVTLKLENVNTGEELQWTGDIDNGEDLTINCQNWTVELEGVVDMDSVVGEFPYLEGGVTNYIKVTALYATTAGNLNITYRDRYF